MWERCTTITAIIWVSLGLNTGSAWAQSTAPAPSLDQFIQNILGQDEPQFTPAELESETDNLSIKIIYDGPSVAEKISLEVSISKPSPNGITSSPTPVLMKTLFLNGLSQETKLKIALPDLKHPHYIDAVVRDANRNIILQARQPVPVTEDQGVILTLLDIEGMKRSEFQAPDFTAQGTIRGKIILPKNHTAPAGANVHIQLLEDAPAGGLSMSLAAEQLIPLNQRVDTIDFNLERGLWERENIASLVFKTWITDTFGRKIFVMRAPVIFTGADIEYEIGLDAIKQGKDTKRGLNLRPELMAQALIKGVASFEPVKGIPSDARLKIVLKQDRGQYNENPVLTEQTLILRGMETRIPFSLVTDSTHFDPYAPSPFITVSLTDSFGRTYYTSGDIRAQEGDNSVRLYPQ